MGVRGRMSYYKRKIDLYVAILSRKYFFKSLPGIVIVGCGRSGTTYTSKLFLSYGYKIGHERLLIHGISSWLLLAKSKQVIWGPSMEEIKVLNLPIVHQIRHPLQVVSSLQSSSSISMRFIQIELDLIDTSSHLFIAMNYWYYWNIRAEGVAQYTYRVEDLDDAIAELFKIGGFTIKSRQWNEPKKNTNTRKHTDLTWEDLEREDKELTKKIKELATKYGYDVK